MCKYRNQGWAGAAKGCVQSVLEGYRASPFYLCLYCNLMWDFACCQSEVKALSEEKESLKQQLDSSSSTVAILQDEKSKLQREVAESKKEQDDLLVLLADQDQKISALKIKLKDLGVPVSEGMGSSEFLGLRLVWAR